MSKASAVAATSALRLLEQYEEGKSFFWSSPLHTMLAQGEWKRLSDAPSSSIGAMLWIRMNSPIPACGMTSRFKVCCIGFRGC